MDEQFSFDINFDFLDASTPNVKPNTTISPNYSQPAEPPHLDVETLASKIASVNDLVLQLKTLQDEHAKLQKQMQDLSDSAMSIGSLYEQEKIEKAKYALASQEFKEKYELAESQLANKTLHFEQLSSKIEESVEKGPIPYNALMLRYHRLAVCLDEDKLLNSKEKLKLQQIQEYMLSKKLTPLPQFKKKKHHLQSKPEQRNQEVQCSAEMVSRSTFTNLEVVQKKLISQGTQHTSYTTTRGTNTEKQSAKKELKTQGTQYISSATTRGTSTTGFITTHSIGTNFPDESTILINDIFNEMLCEIRPLSPLAEELPPPEKIETKTVSTMTGLKNVRKVIDYATPVNIKSSDSRPPSRNMYERVKNELPFIGVPTMNSFLEHGANSSSVPNNITELWNLLGHTFFSLLQNVNTLNNPMNMNVINDRMRNAHSSEDQPRNNSGGPNFAKDYFDEPCRNSNSPRGFIATSRSTATSPIPELETPTIAERRTDNNVVKNATVTCPNANASIMNHNNPNPPVEIQKIILNRVFQGESDSSPQVRAQTLQEMQEMEIKKMRKKLKEKSKKKSSKMKANECGEKEMEYLEEGVQNKSIHTCTVATELNDDFETKAGDAEERCPSFFVCPEQRFTASNHETLNYNNLENELFGTSDDELPPSGTCPTVRPVCPLVSETTNKLTDKSDSDVFCKPLMPKKRKQNSIDTRMFHMGELKGVHQFIDVTKKKALHSKRKRSAKPLNNFSKVRVCSEPPFDVSSWSDGVISTHGHNETLPSDILTSGSVPNGTQTAELSTDRKIIFRSGPGPLCKVKEREMVNVSGQKVEMQPVVQRNLPPPCEVVSVIEGPVNKPSALKSDHSAVANVVPSVKEDQVKQTQSELTNLPPQISDIKQIPLRPFPETYTITPSEQENSDPISAHCSVTNILEVGRKEASTEINFSRVSASIHTGNSQASSEEIKSSPQSSQDCVVNTNPSSEMLATYTSQCPKSPFENLLLDEDHERFQEIFHQICDEFATPERPVSAIPPCESSEAEDSFSEEAYPSQPATPTREKTKRRKGSAAVTAVKRSERLKAKNSVQEAIKYSSLKIPAIELGKYTKKKTELKSENKPVENTLPLPNQDKHEAVTNVECRFGFFNDLEKNSVAAEGSGSNVPKEPVTSGSEEDTPDELVIDLPDETLLTLEHAENDLFSKISTHSVEILATVQPEFVNFDESPCSPPPGDREPEADHVPRRVTEKTNKQPRSNSLLSQIIGNYNHEYHKKVMQSRKEQDKSVIKLLQTIVTDFTNSTGDGEDLIRIVEKIYNITKCEQIISHSLILVVKTAPRPEAESASPVPELYLSQTLRKIIALLEQLYPLIPNLRAALLTNIEKSIFSFTKDFFSLDMTMNLTQMYLAAIADVDAPSNPARLFICKCLFFYTKKAIPMVYETLCVYPSVLPLHDDPNYDRSDALISTIKCLLMSIYYDAEKCDLKAKQMLHKLRNFYNYESLKPTREEVIENLIAKLRAGRFKNVSYSFAIIGKRMEQKDMEKKILGEQLLPLANEYYQTIGETPENDQRIACVLECISYLIKPFPVETDITTYINLFSRFLNATDRQIVQEAALTAILRTIRFGYVQCFKTIYNFQPKYEISNETKVMIRSFIYKKNLDYLRKLENQMQVLTQ